MPGPGVNTGSVPPPPEPAKVEGAGSADSGFAGTSGSGTAGGFAGVSGSGSTSGSAGTAENVPDGTAGTAENVPVGTAGNANQGGAVAAAADAVTVAQGRQFLFGGEFLYAGQRIDSDDHSHYLLMTFSGALQLRTAAGRVLWSTRTRGSGNFAKMGDDGNLTVYTSGPQPIWSSGTYYPYAFVKVQDDGKLVIYDPVWIVPLWQTCRTSGGAGAFCGV